MVTATLLVIWQEYKDVKLHEFLVVGFIFFLVALKIVSWLQQKHIIDRKSHLKVILKSSMPVVTAT